MKDPNAGVERRDAAIVWKSEVTEYETDSLHIRRCSLSDVPDIHALTAMQPHASGALFIGTTSGCSEGIVLVRFDPKTGDVEDTGLRFPAKGRPGSDAYAVGDKIHSALDRGRGAWKGWLFAGHGVHLWWNEVGWVFKPELFEGAHVYAYHPDSGEVRDMGLAARLNAVHGLSVGDGMIVGYTLPGNHFFAFDLASGECRDYGRISGYCCHSFVTWRDKAFGAYIRAHGEQRGERMLAARKSAFLLVYDHASRELTRTEVRLAELEPFIRHNIGMDSWVAAEDCVYGGRVNGEVFRLDPTTHETREYGMAVAGLDKPLVGDDAVRLGGTPCKSVTGSERVTSLNLLSDGRILGTAGFPKMHVFTLDPESGAFTDYGAVNEEHEMCYFHSSCTLETADGDVALAMIETDAERPDVYIAAPLKGEW